MTEDTFTFTVPRPKFAVGQRVKTRDDGSGTIYAIFSTRIMLHSDGSFSAKLWRYSVDLDKGSATYLIESELEAVAPAETEGEK